MNVERTNMNELEEKDQIKKEKEEKGENSNFISTRNRGIFDNSFSQSSYNKKKIFTKVVNLFLLLMIFLTLLYIFFCFCFVFFLFLLLF